VVTTGSRWLITLVVDEDSTNSSTATARNRSTTNGCIAGKRAGLLSRLQFVKSNTCCKIDVPRFGAADAKSAGLNGAEFWDEP
jgi:hypothetical protein